MGNDMCVDHRPVPVDRRPVPVGPQLRALLHTCRRAAGNLSQRAAAQRAGISAVYWQKIESGAGVRTAPVGTLAAMFLATKADPGHLRDEGYPDIAAAMDDLTRAATREVGTEEYLAGTPGANPEEISVLQAVWRALRAGRTPDPFGPELSQSQRRAPDESNGQTGQPGLKPVSNQT